MKKQCSIAILLVMSVIIAPGAFGAAAQQKSAIISAVKEAQSAEESSQEAPTMMEAFLVYHHSYIGRKKAGGEASEKVRKDMFEWLSEQKNVSLLDMLQREQEFTKAPQHAPEKAPYDVFYHAHAGQYRTLYMLYRSVLQFEQQQDFDDFIPVRFWHSFQEYTCFKDSDVVQFLTNVFFPAKTDDTSPKIYPHLLSVNLSFLGNLYGKNSSTAHYYRDNFSYTTQDIGPLVRQIGDYYDFDTDEFEKIIGTSRCPSGACNSVTGEVLQIFIPRKYVDKVVYLARPFGPPYTRNLGFDGFEQLGQDTYQLKITPIIDSIRSGTFLEHLRGHIDDRHAPLMMDILQARIVLGNDVMLNPDSGVKIFRYDQLAPQKRHAHQQAMEYACNAMFIDWLERIRTGTVKKEALQRIANTPIGKLVQDRKRVEDLIDKLKPRARL